MYYVRDGLDIGPQQLHPHGASMPLLKNLKDLSLIHIYTADALIVGRFLDEAALAAVTSSGSLIFMMVGFFNGIAMGAGVVIAKYFGAKDERGVYLAVHTDVAFGLVAGVVLTVLGVAFTPTILRWMKTPENVLPNSIIYFRIYFCGAIFVVMYNIFVGILQAVGDSKHPLFYLICSSLLNVVLDLLFVGGFHWGVWSAALATTISQGASVALCLIRLTKYETPYQLHPRLIRFHLPTLKNVIRLDVYKRQSERREPGHRSVRRSDPQPEGRVSLSKFETGQHLCHFPASIPAG